jgi:EAL domain-containing protein (putative c-di-GMP-specific phosphodiesterase class I)
LDDFGTGYSSLSHLHRFPLDLLKIDQSFVRRMTTGGKSEIVRTILALGNELSMGVIAEGVETAEQYKLLRDLKCKEGQGYFFAKPLEAQAAGEMLEDGNRWGIGSPPGKP